MTSTPFLYSLIALLGIYCSSHHHTNESLTKLLHLNSMASLYRKGITHVSFSFIAYCGPSLVRSPRCLLSILQSHCYSNAAETLKTSLLFFVSARQRFIRQQQCQGRRNQENSRDISSISNDAILTVRSVG